MKTKTLTTIAMLSVVALIIFAVEALIPMPLPFLKLGLSNVVILFALWTMGPKEAGCVLLVRILLSGFVVGNLMSLMISLGGGVLCFAVMCLLKPLFSKQQIWILSIFGALAHNAGQLLVVLLFYNTGALVYAPLLIFAALVTGFLTGQAAQATVFHMEKLRGSRG